MRKLSPCWTVSLAAAAVLALAAPVLMPAFRSQESPQVIEAKGLLSCDSVRPGETFKAAVILKIQPGYHINDNAPLDEFAIPTELAFADDPALEVVEIAYPGGRRARFSYSEAELVVYEGETVLGALIKVKSGTPAGPLTLKGTLSYQACNNESCLPPKELPFEITVPVVTTGTCVPGHPEIFDKIRFKSLQKR
jgi:thiol:disulfide interchange protein DsbD